MTNPALYDSIDSVEKLDQQLRQLGKQFLEEGGFTEKLYQVRQQVKRKITMTIHNEDIKELTAEIPEGHKHLRTTIVLQDGTEYVLQEAAIANLVRAYIMVKTHPVKRKVTLKGMSLSERKDDYAEWQLVEEE